MRLIKILIIVGISLVLLNACGSVDDSGWGGDSLEMQEQTLQPGTQTGKGNRIGFGVQGSSVDVGPISIKVMGVSKSGKKLYTFVAKGNRIGADALSIGGSGADNSPISIGNIEVAESDEQAETDESEAESETETE